MGIGVGEGFKVVVAIGDVMVGSQPCDRDTPDFIGLVHTIIAGAAI